LGIRPAIGPCPLDASLASLKSINARHYADKVTQSTTTKNLNTVVDRSVVDVSAEMNIIRAGKAQKIGESYIVNGRTYSVHDGTLYPTSGPGVYTLDRGGYKTLGVLNKFGNTSQADEILKNMGVSDQTKAIALDVWRKIKK
jgi:hypothetical protein